MDVSGHKVCLRVVNRTSPDAYDAAAICEAIQRPHMRFVPLKTLKQQSRLMVHRARQGFVVQRTATLNRIRGLLSEVMGLMPAASSDEWFDSPVHQVPTRDVWGWKWALRRCHGGFRHESALVPSSLTPYLRAPCRSLRRGCGAHAART